MSMSMSINMFQSKAPIAHGIKVNGADNRGLNAVHHLAEVDSANSRLKATFDGVDMLEVLLAAGVDPKVGLLVIS